MYGVNDNLIDEMIEKFERKKIESIINGSFPFSMESIQILRYEVDSIEYNHKSHLLIPIAWLGFSKIWLFGKICDFLAMEK